jgi:alpha-tubulin suppressor-like RCC1 family protein
MPTIRLMSHIAALAALGAWAAAPLAAVPDGRGVTVPLQAVSQFAAGTFHSCAVADAAVYCWGANNYGQLGNGGSAFTVYPQRVRLPLPAQQVGTGRSHSCALAGGRIWCWGFNDNGQLGNGSFDTSRVPLEVTGLGGTATALAVGDFHTCAIVANAAKCWGSNLYGSIGDGGGDDRTAPVAVAVLGANVSAIAAGVLHSCAIAGGAAYCWGNNFSGQVGNNSSATVVASPAAVASLPGTPLQVVAAGVHSCALVAGGGVYCWGANTDGELGTGGTSPSAVPAAVSGLAGAAASIAVGTTHSCARVGTVVQCWGGNGNAQLGEFEEDSSPLPVTVTGLDNASQQVGARGNYSCVQTADSGLTCWGLNVYGQLGDGSAQYRTTPVQVYPPGSGVSVVGAGAATSCAGVPGGLACWGYNGEGTVGVEDAGLFESLPLLLPAFSQAPSAVSGGNGHICAAVAGAAWCWGDNERGQLGSGPGPDAFVPVAVSGLGSGVSLVAAGSRHSCALVNGGAWCWGAGTEGQLGDGTALDSDTPVAVSGLGSGVTALAAGYAHTCAIHNGAAKCWGLNTDGQLGIGTSTGFNITPVAVQGLDSGVQDISAGVLHTCAVRNGAALCWGYDGYGQLGNGVLNDSQNAPSPVAGLSSGVTRIVAGDDIGCAVWQSSVLCWGSDYDGDLGNGRLPREVRASPTPVIGLSNIAAGPLAIRGTHVCAATLAGGLYCWGDDIYGSLGVGRRVIASKPRPVVVQDVIFANSYD